MRKARLLCICLLLGFSFSCKKADQVTASVEQIRTPQGAFNWAACRGQVVYVNLNKHPYTESLIPEIPAFEKLTGIKVDYSILGEEEYFEKLIISLSTRSKTLDVFMTGPQLNWGYINSGWVEPLNTFLDDPKNVPDDYGLDDFYPSLLAANRWNKQSGKSNLGTGSLWSIPIQVETYILAYRKDWAEKAGVKPPRTYDEFYDFARMLSQAGGKYGIISRGLGTWPTINTGFMTGFSSYGCVDFDENMKCRINSPKAVAFTKLWIKTIKDFGPPDWPNMTWYDGKQKFSSGDYGMYPDCDFFAASYENPAGSSVVGRVGYALPPAGPDHVIKSNLWSWGLAINSTSPRKLASWLFLLWATSRDQLLSTAIHGNMNPTRKSVWEAPEVRSITSRWTGYREVVDENLNKNAAIQWTPQTEFIAVGDRWALAIQEIWSGKDAQKALDEAAADIDRSIANAYKK
ncbi:MAG: sugar ABC transporter substrate-binding protein [Acidobacteriota bacterium]